MAVSFGLRIVLILAVLLFPRSARMRSRARTVAEE
jgi:hypothetical protein